MGVRYNSEKRKVGMYYTTPIYQFRMKCHLCPNHIEIKTDPGNLDYVIVSGARRQEKRNLEQDNGTVMPEDKGFKYFHIQSLKKKFLIFEFQNLVILQKGMKSAEIL